MHHYRFLVTCAAGDIGRELCFHLAKKEHDLIITGRDLEKLKKLSDDIKAKYPNRAITICSADLGQPEAMQELIMHTKTISIDGIVLMLPRPPVLPKNSDSLAQFQILNQAMRDCFTGPRFLLQQLIPSLKQSELKSIVLVSGSSSKQPILNPEWEPFNNIRTLWVGCLKTFADTYGSEGIRFNTISPGQVMTSTYENKLKTESLEKNKLFTEILREKTSTVPLGKFATIRGVIKTIYFFLKSSGSNEITATNTLIDGGQSRPYF